jgi:hypothetical protein
MGHAATAEWDAWKGTTRHSTGRRKRGVVTAVWTRVYNWTQESEEDLGEKKRVGNVGLPGFGSCF